jgi:L-threonylcarbamoyladenylate synthase
VSVRLVPRRQLDTVVAALEAGGIVVVPTDTVYGLAARLDRPGAVELMFEAKGRPAGLAVPVLIGRTADVGAVASEWPAPAARLAGRFWPGPITLVVPARPEIGPRIGGDGLTVGIRWPADRTIEALSHRVGPLAVTSANRHGEPPCTTAEEVQAAFADVAVVMVAVDGGTCDGAPSTVVDCTADPPRCLRSGLITPGAVAAALR